MLKKSQNALDNRGAGKTATNEQRAEIESKVLKFEEREIKHFASYNSRLVADPLSEDALTPFLHELAEKKSLFEKGQISEEEVQIAEIELQLAKEKNELNHRFTNLFVSANNPG
jgi:hypothetical protein